MSETKDLQAVPQFQTAEFADQRPTLDNCCICQRSVAGSYYRINGAVACLPCADQVQARIPKDTHAAFTRAILFGLGGALLGLVLYSGVGILLHLEIGYVSLAVGYIVGKAIILGSGNVGGRRYQLLALALTYASVSISAIPIAISQSSHHVANIALTKLLAILMLYGLASPFLEIMDNPLSGALGVIILLVGVRIAWRITAGPRIPTVEGPY